MTGMATSTPIIAFADLEAGLWGLACGGDAPQAMVSTLSGAGPELAPARLDADGSRWTVNAPGLTLDLEPLEAPTATADAERRIGACRVTGAATIDGGRRELAAGGIRLSHATADTAGSLRLFGGWFAGGAGLGLLAVRAPGATHDRDSVSVIAVGEEHPEVLDPRLSTTYDADGVPRRIGIELWLADEPEGEQQWARHAAGAVTGSAVTGGGALASLRAQALTCSSRGQTGAGVFLLLG